MEKNKKVMVTNEFVTIFKNFNVVDQTENIKNLSQKERYLLLTLCLDKFEPEDPVAKYNFQPFKDEVMEIYDVQDDKTTENKILLELIDETEDMYIDTDMLVTSEGESLPQVLTKEEVRDMKISLIDNDNSK